MGKFLVFGLLFVSQAQASQGLVCKDRTYTAPDLTFTLPEDRSEKPVVYLGEDGIERPCSWTSIALLPNRGSHQSIVECITSGPGPRWKIELFPEDPKSKTQQARVERLDAKAKGQISILACEEFPVVIE